MPPFPASRNAARPAHTVSIRVPEGRTCLLSSGELADEIVAAWERSQIAIKGGDKEALRALHLVAKRQDEAVDVPGLRRDLVRLGSFFPEPSSIDPTRIDPELILVTGHRSLEGKLFRLLRAYWSMPFSKGYGRRLRFLVMDRHHQAVIGLLGMQSPPADLLCRDRYFGSTKANKLAIANTTMDAYTVGASPTYAPLLGGKLVAGFLHSEKIRQAYWRAYGAAETVMEGCRLSQPLLAITTSSAFGRSSIYNRLKFGSRALAKPLGYTKGYGTVHLESLYPHIVAWLKDHEMHVPAGFGHGPKVRWQNVTRALIELGVPRTYLNHGVEREVFIFEFASNLQQVHQKGALPEMEGFDDSGWADFWKERWCLKRVASRPDWHSINVREQMEAAIAQFL